MNSKQLIVCLQTDYLKHPERHLKLGYTNLILARPEQVLKSISINKISSFFHHLLVCRQCKSRLSPSFVISLYYLYSREKRISNNLLRLKNDLAKNLGGKIKMVFLKDITKYRLDYSTVKFQPRADLDILIETKDTAIFENYIFRKGFSLVSELKGRETTYKDKNETIIDLHYQLIRKSLGQSSPLPATIVKIMTMEVIRTSHRDKSNIYYPRPEYFFLHLCLHYFFHNRCYGLRNLYDIYAFLQRYHQNFNDGKLMRLLTDYKVRPYIIYVTELSQRIFGKIYDLPQSLQSRLLIKILIKLRRPESIDLCDLWDNYHQKKKKHFYLTILLWEANLYEKITYYWKYRSVDEDNF